ncbi:hypothetical protein H6763_02565 [Candidatus Nomurabacteria bacterium]|uniref:Uncharacterized protein n=1 Tax=Candidatus Dojkabacteria bacterium TaxID=2099670 RepID=A0A955I0I5_9BACT|nr:hypothetical protein [Candidatus Dojkabacteria bacterium]MCB9789367.1 hypothetical protein [Candidatus Nomurabacteria bacterium]MCB9803689.1 hypothetical protein [Candidatus Nomurabacteria bacterium]
MNIKIKRILPKSFDLKRYSVILGLSLITTIMLASALIAMPYTEKISSKLQYDLNLKENSYKARRYTVELDLTNEDPDKVEQKIVRTKDIIMKRLLDYGVESVSITEANDTDPSDDITAEVSNEGIPVETTGLQDDTSGDKEQKRYLDIQVDTSKDIDIISQIIRSRSFIRIVTPKEDVDFNNPDDQIAQYLPDNYNDTKFTRYSFRNIAIKELPTSTGGTAYFGIYKVNPTDKGDFLDLLDKYAGQRIGIEIDGFVSPTLVPSQFDRGAQTNRSVNPEFAPVVGQNRSEAQIADILLNSGVIPLQYSVTDEVDLASSVIKPDYPTALFAILAGVIATIGFIGFRNRKEQEETVIFFLSAIGTLSVWITYLKFFYLPVDLDVMILTGFILIYLVKLFTYRRKGTFELEIVVLATSIMFVWLTGGYTDLLAKAVLEVALFALIIVNMMGYYINNIRRYLLK